MSGTEPNFGFRSLLREWRHAASGRAFHQWERKLRAAASEFVYPPVCLWCARPARAAASDVSGKLCERCHRQLAPMIPDRCGRCSAPVGPNLDSIHGCIHCRDESWRFERAISLGPYEKELQQATVRCKHPYQGPLTAALTELLLSREADVLRSWKINAVIPIPHHWWERVRRRHHPADTIAETLGRFLMVPVERHILVKVKRTPRQTLLSTADRRRNLVSALGLSGSPRLKGARLLLADDVLTTGTTARRAARVLMDAGAASVHVAVLARVIRT